MEHRPFPPSPRRRAAAREAGLHAASPLLVGAAAAAALLIALGLAGAAIAHRLTAAIAAACAGRPVLTATGLSEAVAAIALPMLGAAAAAAIIAQLVQTGTLWLPRRRIAGAPSLPSGPMPRTRRTAGELAGATAIAAAAFAWLWWAAPRLAALMAASSGPIAATASPLLAGAAGLLVHLAGALIAVWAIIAALDATARRIALTRALAMTAAEKREDDRLTGADPRWRTRRAELTRGPTASAAVAGATVVLLGDDTAVAIAWHPAHRPIPIRTASGRGPRAAQLIGLARRHRIPIHRDASLAAALATGDGPVPEPEWPRLAAIIAAARGRDRTRGPS